MFDFILFFISILIIILAIVATIIMVRKGKPTRLPNGAVMGYYIQDESTGEMIGPVGAQFIINSVTIGVLPWSRLVSSNEPIRLQFKADMAQALANAYDGDIIEVLSISHRNQFTVIARVIELTHRTGWFAQGMSRKEKAIVANAKASW
jgi:hypothetical protein